MEAVDCDVTAVSQADAIDSSEAIIKSLNAMKNKFDLVMQGKTLSLKNVMLIIYEAVKEVQKIRLSEVDKTKLIVRAINEYVDSRDIDSADKETIKVFVEASVECSYEVIVRARRAKLLKWLKKHKC